MLRERSFSAAGLSMMRSATGSHLIFERVSMAIWPSQPGVAERSATEAGVSVVPRVFTHVMNSW